MNITPEGEIVYTRPQNPEKVIVRKESENKGGIGWLIFGIIFGLLVLAVAIILIVIYTQPKTSSS